MSEDRVPTAAEFDEWYADMVDAPVKDEIQLQSFHDEGTRVLGNFDRSRRVLATATAP